ncbi:FkbM family methyltransferase [Flavobacterium sp.]|uniref:FkbM family methyltransferase n=1 Tax=Flavobacterium sp. TaxID=239 RepID=UPI0039E3F98E
MNNFLTRYRNKRFYSKLIEKDALCFDIGANHGSKSKLLLSLGAKVIAFEPQSSCWEVLTALKNKNPDFDFHPFAVGAQEDEKVLHLANHSEVATLSSAFVDYFTCDEIHWNETETVQVKSLDALIADFGLPDFCKIDTEGYELEILSHLSHPIPLIEFEFTGGFTEDTLKIIDLLDNGKTQFNYVRNEKLQFQFDRWVDATTMKTVFKSLPKARLHGNIFVKNEQ